MFMGSGEGNPNPNIPKKDEGNDLRFDQEKAKEIDTNIEEINEYIEGLVRNLAEGEEILEGEKELL